MAQLELFAPGPRVELSDGAWVEHHIRWVPDHAELFAELRATAAWREETMRMYDRVVTVPRLLSGALPHPRVEEMRRELSARYGEEFVRTTLALYRDGRDSVAMHGDTTVSLGAARRFVLRPTAGGRSITFDLGGGDLFVMGGTCQRTWRHGVPKVAHAGERIALMFRPKWGDRYP